MSHTGSDVCSHSSSMTSKTLSATSLLGGLVDATKVLPFLVTET